MRRIVSRSTAVWSTTTKRLDGVTKSNVDETFRGTSFWRLEFSDNPGKSNDIIRIVDRYHTSRQTLGTVEVRFKSQKRFNSFDPYGAEKP